MRSVVTLALIAFLSGSPLPAQVNIEIALKSGSPAERRTKDQLQRLLQDYDVSAWVFTKSVVIDEKAIPHSHPVLTLSARHVRDDELLLSTFLHEQIHWFLARNHKSTEEAKRDLRRLFPRVPASFPEGAKDEESTYLHLLVVYLEYRACREALGELRARQVMEFWASDHYTWVYRTVLERARDVGRVVSGHRLVPPGR
jgi:hypothetical protein